MTQLYTNTFAYQEKDSLIVNRLFSKGYKLWESVEKKGNMNDYASFLGSYLAYLYLHNNGFDYGSIESAMDSICQKDETEFHTRLNYFYNRSVKEEYLFNEQAAYDYCDKAISICEQNIERPEIKERLAQMLCQKATGGQLNTIMLQAAVPFTGVLARVHLRVHPLFTPLPKQRATSMTPHLLGPLKACMA